MPERYRRRRGAGAAAARACRRASGAVLDGLHGLVIAGGADVDPECYGQQRAGRPAPRGRPGRVGVGAVAGALARRSCRCWQSAVGCRYSTSRSAAPGAAPARRVGSDAHCPTVGEHGRHPVASPAAACWPPLLGQRGAGGDLSPSGRRTARRRSDGHRLGRRRDGRGGRMCRRWLGGRRAVAS